MLIHAAWDELAISDLFSGILPSQKSIKTRCGKRVAFSHVAHDGVSCATCLADRKHQADMTAKLKQLYPDFCA